MSTAKSNGPKVWKCVADGIYRHNPSGTLYERPQLANGKYTFKTLETKNLKLAKEEFHRRRAGVVQAKPEVSLTVGDLISRYQADGYLDHDLNGRPEQTRSEEERHCNILLPFWRTVEFDAITDAICDNYKDWRKERVKQGSGERTVDRELNTLNNALVYCKRRVVIKTNPLADRPKYQSSKAVRHCREFMPGDAAQLHACAVLLMMHPHSAVLGFQLLFEAYTGLRTCEVLQWRTDAGPDGYGYVMPDGKFMRVWRCKNQHLVNPYVTVHEGLKALIEAHREWKAKYAPESPWYFPSHCGGRVNKGALAHALRRLFKKRLMSKHTSHSMRAFYVTVRRSQGATDAQIAFEIGHQSGGATLASTYGGVPPNWLNGTGPNMPWLPAGKKAWEDVRLPKALQDQPQSTASQPACPPQALAA